MHSVFHWSSPIAYLLADASNPSMTGIGRCLNRRYSVKSTTMKLRTYRPAAWTFACCSLIFTACGTRQEEDPLERKNRTLVSANIAAHARLDEYAAYVREIEADLRNIRNRQESLVEFIEIPAFVPSADPIPSHLSAINEMLDEGRFKLSSMREELREAAAQLKKDQGINGALRAELGAHIAAIDSLEHTLTERTIALELMQLEQWKLLEQLKQESTAAFRAYFAYGTWKELQAEGIAIREGGIFGLGGVRSVRDDFDPEFFSAIDMRETERIPIHCAKAQLLSPHPGDSYRWEGEDSIQALCIVDPDRFWQNTRYLTISVKQ